MEIGRYGTENVCCYSPSHPISPSARSLNPLQDEDGIVKYSLGLNVKTNVYFIL